MNWALLLWINLNFYECYQFLLQNYSRKIGKIFDIFSRIYHVFAIYFFVLGGHLLCSCKNRTVKKVIWALFILQLYLRSNFRSEDNDFSGAFVAKMELFSGDKIHIGWVHLNKTLKMSQTIDRAWWVLWRLMRLIEAHGGSWRLMKAHGGSKRLVNNMETLGH